MLAAAQITQAIAARLAGQPLVGARVYTSRAWPLAEADLPAWRVVAVDEDVSPATVHAPAMGLHQLQVELRGACRAVDDLDDHLHALVSEALTAIFNEPGAPDLLSALVGKVQVSLRRIERAMASEGEAAVGQALVTLRAEFHADHSDPDTIL